jgi:hypothetical protein
LRNKEEIDMQRRLQAFAASAALCSGVLFCPGPALAQSENLNKLSADWWEWVASIPTPENPLLDTTGAECAVGQHGPVWFLTGIFGGSSPTHVVRTCTVPAGKDIFFPVANSIFFNTPGVCGQPRNLSYSVEQARQYATEGLTSAARTAELDGTAIQSIQRVASVPFSVSLPEDNIFDAVCLSYNLGNLPAGTYAPAADDGYYVLLTGLTPGKHTLRFQVRGVLDVTYKLNIVLP